MVFFLLFDAFGRSNSARLHIHPAIAWLSGNLRKVARYTAVVGGGGGAQMCVSSLVGRFLHSRMSDLSVAGRLSSVSLGGSLSRSGSGRIELGKDREGDSSESESGWSVRVEVEVGIGERYWTVVEPQVSDKMGGRRSLPAKRRLEEAEKLEILPASV